MCASHSVLYRHERRNKYNSVISARGATLTCLFVFIDGQVVCERTCRYPKDGELYLGKMKPEETLVEVCSGSDVQIDRQT